MSLAPETDEKLATPPGTAVLAPYPGSHAMPRWNVAELIDAPIFTWRNVTAMLGPALLMGGAAIGGGEWLAGPAVTARYGGGLMWLATFSILGQVIYNIEISRYTLYTGEPIFTGKFRTLPGPAFWVFLYLLLDFGSVFPYLAANAATPVAAVILGRIPEDNHFLLRPIGIAIFLLAFVPLVFGGKIYNSLKLIMTIKIVTVMSFLLVLGVLYTKPHVWVEIFSGFAKIGNVPVVRGEDANNNGILDPGEDWDGDGRLDRAEPELWTLDLDLDGVPDAPDLDGDRVPDRRSNPASRNTDINADGIPDVYVVAPGTKRKPDDKSPQTLWPDLDGDGKPDTKVHVDSDGDGKADVWVKLDKNDDGKPSRRYFDFDGDKIRDGDNIENVFTATLTGQGFPNVDLSMIAFLGAFAAIAGSGGLSNTPTSNYTRDQGWGMGHHVGAIPSMIGGHELQLSHVGTVFLVTPEALQRWKRWYRHVMRDQLVIWMPACFFGIALPSMLSVAFLSRGTEVSQSTAAGMTAGGVYKHVTEVSGSAIGGTFWYLTLICGFLVLAPTMASTADGVIRRWVDVFWTSSPTLRKMRTDKIKYVYFCVLCGYLAFGLLMLCLPFKPTQLLTVGTNFMNYALGFSCWHTLVLNTVLLPKELRPNWFIRITMACAGLFFVVLATLSLCKSLWLI